MGAEAHFTDMDAIAGEKHSLRLDGKEFDLTIIPFGLHMKFFNALDAADKIREAFKCGVTPEDKDLDMFFTVTGELFKLSHPECDGEWLKKKVSVKGFFALYGALLTALVDNVGKKNEAASPEGESE